MRPGVRAVARLGERVTGGEERHTVAVVSAADVTGAGAPLPADAQVTDPARAAVTERALAEATLVARARDGDVAGFEQLVRAYEGELVRLGYRMLGDIGEAQDAAQEAMTLAWTKLPTLVDPQAFHAWVYRLMTRHCLNVLRTRGRRRTGVGRLADVETQQRDVAADAAGTGPAQRAQADALREGLTGALAALPSDLRACWVLNAMHDLTYPEIAYAIGVPVSTVRGRIARARLQLAKGMTAWQ